MNRHSVTIFIKNLNGVHEKMIGHVGESLYEVMSRYKITGVNSEGCNGYDMTYRPHLRPQDIFSDGPVCGQCRVKFNDNWYDRVTRETQGVNGEEETKLYVMGTLEPNQRLACCIPIETWMEGMTVEANRNYDPNMVEDFC